MTFALLNLNPLEILLGLLCLGFVAALGTVLLIFVLNPKNRRPSSSQHDDFERLRDDHERALDRIAALEEEVKRLRLDKSTPSEGHFTP